MAYSAVGDLLIGDLLISESVDRQKFVDLAAEEIDSKLGWVYELPLHGVGVPPSDTSWQSFPIHQVSLLKSINNRLATGRLILTLDIAGEGTQLHAYGWHLVNEALGDLMVIANGDQDLDAVRSTALITGGDKRPSIKQQDEESLLLGWENTVMRSRPWYTRPGSLS